MKNWYGRIACCLLISVSPAVPAAEEAELDALRQELDRLRRDYDKKIEQLENRLEPQQQDTKTPPAQPHAVPTPGRGQVTDKAFNPAISLILNGSYTDFELDPEGYFIPGFALGEETGPGEEGLSLAESELVVSANVDDKFYGAFTLALTPDNEAEIEEAYFQTLTLPWGFTLKAGRFYSGIAYLNEQHTHRWDFADTALAYRALLANQYGDDGAQLRWLAPTDLFVEFGLEALRGDSYPAAGAGDSGVGANSAFVHIGGDVGVSHSWRVGVSRLYAEAEDRESSESGPALPAAGDFTGDSEVTVVDFVWKWAPNGNPYRTNLTFQAEYLWREEDGVYSNVPAPYDAEQSGWYAQAVYQFMPRWRLGLRYDELDADDPGPAFSGTGLNPGDHTPTRSSAMLDFSNSEFSRFRLQYNRDESRPETDDQWFLQYIMSLGAHGAHQF